MRLFKDIFTKEEIVTDAYPFTEIFDGAGFEIKSDWIIVGAENIDIGI